MKSIEFFYPSFTKKALTFTIDDGNMKYDAMLLDILKPAGIKGTFNLCSNIHKGREEECREFYRGYGIANHCKHHPLVNLDGVETLISTEPFDPDTSDKRYVYRVGESEFYWRMQPNGWRQMVFEDDYIALAEAGLKELNDIFGEGSVRDFVWPYGEQSNSKVKEYLYRTHRSIRKTGCALDRDGFNLPSDKKEWMYNANDSNLLVAMEKYEAYPDDGNLKFFSFGVHSIDFERDSKWDDLREFASKYGNRPDVFWYASVGEIFDYGEAVSLVEITDGAVINRSGLTVYLAVGGEKKALSPGEMIRL